MTYQLDVTGRSMYPTLLDGDRITVESASPQRLRRGDVVYCHDGQRSVVHRLHTVRRTVEGWVLQTRGDCHQRLDAPWVVARLPLFGRVTLARRGERTITVDAWWQRWWFTAPVLPVWLRIKERGVRPLLSALQGLPWYARLTRKRHARVVAALQERTLHRRDHLVMQWQHQGRAIAEVRYYPRSQMIVALWVGWRYRRLGLARRLVEAVLQETQAQGASRVQLTLRPSNRPARRLYEQLGFQVMGCAGSSEDPDLLLEWRHPLKRADGVACVDNTPTHQ